MPENFQLMNFGKTARCFVIAPQQYTAVIMNTAENSNEEIIHAIS